MQIDQKKYRSLFLIVFTCNNEGLATVLIPFKYNNDGLASETIALYVG